MTDFFQFLRQMTLPVLLQAIQAAGRQRLMGLSAEMAYNGLLALFPAVLAMITAIGLFDPPRLAFQQLADNLAEVAPEEVMGLIEGFIADVGSSSNQGLFSLSFIGALWAASSIIHGAMVAMDHIHQIPLVQQRPFWQTRGLALGLTLGTMLLLLLASLVIFVSDLTVRSLASQIGPLQMAVLRFWQFLSQPIALGLVALAFATIYRWGPSRWPAGTPIFPGAILAALFWLILSFGFRFYVTHVVDFNRTYGTLGGVIILLLWLYFGALAMLFGNQLNVSVGSTLGPQRARFPRSPHLRPTARGRERQNGHQDGESSQSNQKQSRYKRQQPYSPQYPDYEGEE